MFCKKCGAQIPDDSIFCVNCGEHMGYQSTDEANNTVNVDNAISENQECVLSLEEQEEMANEVLKWGILGAVFSENICFLGIPFSAKAKRLAAEYEFCKCKNDARVTVGKILGKIGFIVGLVSTIILGAYLSIYFTIMIAFLIGGGF